MAAAGAVAGEAGTAAEEAVLVGIAALRLASRGETRVPVGFSAAGQSTKDDEIPKSKEELAQASAQASTPAALQAEEASASKTAEKDTSQELIILSVEAILKNQDVMKTLMAELMNSVKAMEEKLVRLEREMSLVTRLTQELSEVGDDAWA